VLVAAKCHVPWCIDKSLIGDICTTLHSHTALVAGLVIAVRMCAHVLLGSQRRSTWPRHTAAQ
jgi:hypothetical protein